MFHFFRLLNSSFRLSLENLLVTNFNFCALGQDSSKEEGRRVTKENQHTPRNLANADFAWLAVLTASLAYFQ